jgi:hypothetical protein
VKVPYAMRPGAGFVLLVTSALACLGFFAWGLARPNLDVVAQLQLELRLGRRDPLSGDELRLLQRALCRHPKLAEDLLEGDGEGLISAHRRGLVEHGWAYLIRTPERSQEPVQVQVPAGLKKQHLKVRARTVQAEIEGQASVEAPFIWAPPSQGRCPTLIELRTAKKSDDGKKKTPALIRLGGGAP